MAAAVGFTCDYKPCGKFAYADKASNDTAKKPEGWLTLQNGGPHALEYCSNRCLANVAIERYEAETDKPFIRRPRNKA